MVTKSLIAWWVCLFAACTSELQSTAESSSGQEIISVPGNPSAPCPRESTTCSELYVVAHEDDDLNFMNPDIETSLQRGNNVVVVYLTAGNTNDAIWSHDTLELYWTNRERGVLDAYSQMTDPYQPWTATAPVIATHQVAKYTHSLSSNFPGRQVTLIFLRISDTHLESMWAGYSGPTFDCTGPTRCPVNGQTVMSAQTYTRADLITTLRSIMSLFSINSVSMMDVTNINHTSFTDPKDSGYTEHGSHHTSSLFALAALQQYQAGSVTPVYLRTYRGYTVAQEPPQLSTAQVAEKQRVLSYYAYYDCTDTSTNLPCGAPDLNNCNTQLHPTHACPNYANFQTREYLTRNLVGTGNLQGRLAIQADTSTPVCLNVKGSAVVMGGCIGATSWTLTTINQLQQTGTANCLTEDPTTYAITLTSCSAHTGAWNTVYFLANGQVRLREPDSEVQPIPPGPSGHCLTGSSTGSQPTSAPCAKQCIDNVSGTLNSSCSSTNASCTGEDTRGSCASDAEICEQGYNETNALHCFARPAGIPSATQDWTLLFNPPTLRSSEFSDSQGFQSAASYYRPFSIVNGNVCTRASAGLFCVADVGGVMQPATLVDATYSDANGWYPDNNGATVAGLWNSSTSSFMQCGRGYYGPLCSNGNSTDFSTPSGWNQAPYYYDSLRYYDVDNDGKPDICGRGYYGISCAINQGAGFSTATSWSSDFSAGEGWNYNGYGDTTQYGDIDGDGHADVCARASTSLYCATGQSSLFVNTRPWSFDSDRRRDPGYGFASDVAQDFGDVDPPAFPGGGSWANSTAYYGSLRLIDINRDGLADACARSKNGVYCALSTGSGFERKKRVLLIAEDLTDGVGYGTPDKGSTLTFRDLDGDLRVDMCIRGYYGIVCSQGY